MAHALLEKMLAARGLDGSIRVRSGGSGPHARDGMIPSLDARLVLRADGIHLAEATIVSTDLKAHGGVLAAADLILTVAEAQKRRVRAQGEAPERDASPVG